jgi:hypothetical protein
MPLLDHFHPPLSEERHWEGFHSKWANVLVDELNEGLLPPGYFAEPHVRQGAHVEIDSGWTPPAANFVMPVVFPDTFEVQIIQTESGPTLVAAIELISPSNKDGRENRRAFALKCASYLCQGVSLIMVDIVTSRHANLHDEVMRLLPDRDAFLFPSSPWLYATAYRPIRRGETEQIDIWLTSLTLGQPLPILPLALSGELCLPINLETTYLDACRKLRLI